MHLRLTATLLDTLGIAMYVLDADDRAVLWNDSFLRFFPEHDGHIHPGEHYGDNLRRFYRHRLPDEDQTHIERYVRDGIERNRTQARPFVFQHRGRWLRVAAMANPEGGRVRVWLHLSTAEAWQHGDAPPQPEPAAAGTADPRTPGAAQLLEDVGEGALVLDEEGRILFSNDPFVAMYGLASKPAIAGRTYAELVHGLWQGADAAERAQREQDLAAALRDGAHLLGTPFEVPLPGGRWMRVTIHRTANGQRYAFHADITASHHRQWELLQAAQRASENERQLRALTDQLRTETHHDPLTGLQNRRGLEAQLQAMEDVPGAHALLFVDLDGFKAVNDRAGHAVGDEVLQQVAARLRRSVRTGDAVVRLGGDEFVVLLRHCDAPQAQQVGGKIAEAIGQAPFEVGTQAFRVGASVGVRTFGGEVESIHTLLRDADAACYAAKRNGRGRVELHHGPLVPPPAAAATAAAAAPAGPGPGNGAEPLPAAP